MMYVGCFDILILDVCSVHVLCFFACVFVFAYVTLPHACVDKSLCTCLVFVCTNATGISKYGPLYLALRCNFAWAFASLSRALTKLLKLSALASVRFL